MKILLWFLFTFFTHGLNADFSDPDVLIEMHRIFQKTQFKHGKWATSVWISEAADRLLLQYMRTLFQYSNNETISQIVDENLLLVGNRMFDSTH